MKRVWIDFNYINHRAMVLSDEDDFKDGEEVIGYADDQEWQGNLHLAEHGGRRIWEFEAIKELTHIIHVDGIVVTHASFDEWLKDFKEWLESRNEKLDASDDYTHSLGECKHKECSIKAEWRKQGFYKNE